MNKSSKTHSSTLNIAGCSFTFSAQDEAFALPDAYSQFTVDTATPSPAGTYTLCSDLLFQANQDILWSGTTWRMVREEDAYRVDLRVLDTETWIPTARLSPDFSSGDLVPLVGRNPVISDVSLNYPLDQVIFINRLPRCGAVLLHASGILHNEKVYLFCGRSDIGKTTMARIWRDAGATLLNDDRMLVWVENGTIMASPSPWHGEDPEINLATAPVAGIYHLHQTSQHELKSLDAIKSLSALTATAVLPFYLKENLDHGLDVLQTVAENVSSYRLGFQPTPDVVGFILKSNIEPKSGC